MTWRSLLGCNILYIQIPLAQSQLWLICEIIRFLIIVGHISFRVLCKWNKSEDANCWEHCVLFCFPVHLIIWHLKTWPTMSQLPKYPWVGIFSLLLVWAAVSLMAKKIHKNFEVTLFTQMLLLVFTISQLPRWPCVGPLCQNVYWNAIFKVAREIWNLGISQSFFLPVQKKYKMVAAKVKLLIVKQ